MENYITHLYAKNIGLFEELNVTFNSSFNFIVGPNGSGKTSILKCIALAFDPSRAEKMRYKSPSSVWIDSFLDSKIYRIGLGKGWSSDTDLYRQEKHISWQEPPNEKGITPLLVYQAEEQNINVTPLILGAYRRIEYKKIEGMRRENDIFEQRKTYHSAGFLNIEGGTLPDVKQWMINRYFAIEKEWAIVFKQNWEWIIQNLNTLSPSNCSLAFKEIKRDLEPIFLLNGVDCYLEEISAGFQAFLSLVFAVVEWIEGTNEEDKAYIPEAVGTVIIDELDVHLHPEWQLTIRKSLATIFPKLQFIITTHSPHLIATAAPGELIILPKLSRIINVSPTMRIYSGWNTDQILEDVMGVTSLENKLYSTLVNEAINNVEKKDIAALDQSIEELRKVVHPSNTILQVLQIKSAKLELGDIND